MVEITRKIIGMIGLMFLCTLSVFLYEKTARAETLIPLGDTWTNGYWSDGDTVAAHRYQFTIPSDGKVTVTCQSSYEGKVYLKDKDCAETYNSEVGSSFTFSEYLKAGTYGIEFDSYWRDEGAYKIKVKFTAVGCNVPEPNNDFASATPISLNQLQQGVLTDANKEDYFKIQLNSATTLQIVTTGEERRRVILYNGDFVQIKYNFFDGGADLFEEYLSPGTGRIPKFV